MSVAFSLMGGAGGGATMDTGPFTETATAGRVPAGGRGHDPMTWSVVYFASAVAFLGLGFVGLPRKYRGAFVASGLGILAWIIVWHTLIVWIAARRVADSHNGHGAAQAALSLI